MLAVAKIGAIVLPMFSGFGARRRAQRLNDGHAKASDHHVDGSLRRGKPVGARAGRDEALAHCPGVRHVVVAEPTWRPRTRLAAEAAITGGTISSPGAPDDVAAVATEPMPADDPFLLISPRAPAASPRGRAFALRLPGQDGAGPVDLHGPEARRPLPLDVATWVGWSGRCSSFGGLLVGSTMCSPKGTPNYPEPDRLWRLVERPPRQLPGPGADGGAPVDVASRAEAGRAGPELPARHRLHRRAVDARGLALDLRAASAAARAAAELLRRHRDRRRS